MSMEGRMLRFKAARSDAKRDSVIALPQGVVQYRNISYGSHAKSSLLDVYLPEDTREPLPTIVSIHGGGYVYGTKEVYRRYGMDLAKRGFAFVNFNYRLAPKWKFPTPLIDTNAVLEWVVKNARRYSLDPNRIILVGDSAGAQLTSQYAAMHSNPAYAAHFGIRMAKVTIRAVGLNCGLYDPVNYAQKENRKGIYLDYLGKDISADDPRLRVLDAINENYPPAYITTACHDFLRPCAEPMYRFLREKGVECAWKCYGNEADETVGHVFHVNIALPDAVQCNDDAAAFFKRFV